LTQKTTMTAAAAMVLAGSLGVSAMQAPAARPAVNAKPTATSTTATSSAAVEKVSDPSLVCMVNDMDMGKSQIPVVVAGETYYGCCAMCKERLAKDASVRTAVDPVSGKKVDKAKAVIGKRPDGSVVYFESEKNLRQYAARR
jgi:YHS domain-containing protein